LTSEPSRQDAPPAAEHAAAPGLPSRARRPFPIRTLWRVAVSLVAIEIANVLAVHGVFLLGTVGLELRAVITSVRQILPTFSLLMLAGVAARFGFEAWRGRGRRYARTVASPAWLLGSAVLLLCGGLTVHGYSYLKLMVPLVHKASFDALFWDVDRYLLLGLSPSVFLLELFDRPWLLRAIDWSYVRLYYPVLLAFLAFFLSFRSNRLRFCIAGGFVGLWLSGSWLYLAFPSLGPCYAMSTVWDRFQQYMPFSHETQVRLMMNYVNVLRIAEGVWDGVKIPFGVAAFPSLHVGSQFYSALWVRRLAPRLGFYVMLTVPVMFVGSIVTGWHYMIDSVAGLVMAWAAYRLATRASGLERWRRRPAL